MKKIAFLLFLCLHAWSSQLAQTPNPFIKVSAGTEYQYIGTFDLDKMNKILNKELEEFLAGASMSFADFKGRFNTPEYTVKLYRVTYRSVVPEMDNKPTLASGLVAIPDNGQDSMPVVSYQHGTVFGKNQCPSQPDESMETKLMIAQFASQGYIVIGADYFGLGVSDLPNAYLVRFSSEQVCLDMLYAAQDVLHALKIKVGQLFLHGWSQGGWTNMTFLPAFRITFMPRNTTTGCPGLLLQPSGLNFTRLQRISSCGKSAGPSSGRSREIQYRSFYSHPSWPPEISGAQHSGRSLKQGRPTAGAAIPR
jgi:hypothetical protein